MSSQQLIANELLAFIQHAIDTMDEVSIVQICKSNFKEEEVCSGKALLFQTLGKTDQMPSRRRDGGEKSLQDIITLFKQTDPDDVPAFVAKQLHKLPPVTFDHVDVTRLLRDITSMKASLAEVHSKLEASENTISELRTELLLLRDNKTVCRSSESTNARRGTQNDVSSVSSAKLDAPPAAAVSRSPRPAAPPRPSRVAEATAPPPPRAYAAAVTASRPAAKGRLQSCEPVRSTARNRPDEEGFTEVVRKKRKPSSRNQCGTALTGENHLLRAALPATLLYVSRLHYSTKVEQIVEYVKVKTNFQIRVEQLESRHNSFKSFVCRVPTSHLSTFMNVEFWPRNVLFRRFRGRLLDTAQLRNTPQTLRVNK